jgi:Ca2+-binding EF-hand superfamily protein
MLTEFQKRKLTAMFHGQDGDHDGFLDQDDYEQYTKGICEIQNFLPGSAEYEALHAQNMAVWEQVRQVADQDGDNRVSLEEFLRSYDITLNDEKLSDQLVRQYARSVMAVWDRDGNGRLSGVELVTLLGCYGVEGEAAREAFRHLDRDGSGYLTVEGLMERIEEFYRSEDPDAPGNWLFGPY